METYRLTVAVIVRFDTFRISTTLHSVHRYTHKKDRHRCRLDAQICVRVLLTECVSCGRLTVRALTVPCFFCPLSRSQSVFCVLRRHLHIQFILRVKIETRVFVGGREKNREKK